MLTPFDAATKLFDYRQSQPMPFRKRMNLYFIDYELIPLLIQENYLSGYYDNKTLKDVTNVAESADFISLGDTINKTLRTQNEWSLLPDIGFCSSIAPCAISAKPVSFVKFPAWFGKNSKVKKTVRQLKEITESFAGKLSASSNTILNEILPIILQKIVKLLQEETEEKVIEAISLMNNFRISIEQFKENILDLCANDKAATKFTMIDTKIKSMFTRLYHKLHPDPIQKTKKIKGRFILILF